MRSIAVASLAGLLLLAACASRSGSPPPSAGAPANTIGKFVWHDLVTDDLEAAKRFYGALLEWQFTETTRGGRRYAIARRDGQPVGGLVAIDAVDGREVSQWIGYQSVADVDQAAGAVGAAGGKTLIPPVNVGSAGRAAIVGDPQGAPFGLLRLAAGDPADTRAPAEGTFFWMEYLARDVNAVAEFYARTFGYERAVTDRLGANEYVVLSRGRPRAGILPVAREDVRPVWLPYVLVTDAAAAVARARMLGATVLLEPRAEIRNGSLAVVTDPSGAMVALQKFPF